MSSETELSTKHQAFINEYLKIINATKAYQEVYPDASEESARRLGSQLLTNVDVKAEISKRIDVLRERIPHDLIQHLKNLIFFNPADLLDDDGNIDTAKFKEDKIPGILSSITVHENIGPETSSRKVSFKLTDQNKAIEIMSKLLKLYDDKTEVNINIPPINISFSDADSSAK